MKLLAFLYILISAALKSVSAVITLQLPGLTYATGTSTVDVDFLDIDSKPIYTLKGEVLMQTLPMQSNNVYLPNNLTGNSSLTGGPNYVSKIRINAGESGMVLKLFEGEYATVPSLFVVLVGGFLSSASTLPPIEIDLLKEGDQNINGVNINWINRNIDELKRTKGMQVAKLEVHVERMEAPQLVTVKSLGIVSLKSNKVLLPEAMNAAIQEPSMIQGPNSVYLPAAKYPNMYSQYPQMYYQYPAPPNSFNQYPNAPQFAQ